MTHYLKLLPEYFQAILDGRKTDELRREDDRTFAVGDVLVLREYIPTPLYALDFIPNPYGYTGRSVTVTVTYIVRDTEWLQPGVAALSIRPIEPLLKDLRLATNQALARAAGQVDGAINWADLACREVRKWTDDTGDSGYTVYIEEADPEAAALQQFVQEWVAAVGFIDVEVVTAW